MEDEDAIDRAEHHHHSQALPQWPGAIRTSASRDPQGQLYFADTTCVFAVVLMLETSLLRDSSNEGLKSVLFEGVL